MANHVGKNAKTIRRKLQKNFGINESQIDAAIKGDELAIQKIAQAGIEGDKISRLAPRISEKIIQSIQGTEAENKMYTDIYSAAGNATANIESMEASTLLSNRSLIDYRKEQAQKFVNDRKVMNAKLEQNLEFLRMQAEVRNIEMIGNHEYRVQKLQNQIPLKQMQAERDYKEQVIEHYLENGDNAQVELVARKNFGGFLGRVTNFLTGK
ncbi:MAG: hypothetical protein HC907_22120 [Richelia sp. SM1_7_0]|nr:hypothetical protein [Richelia sp. SM1_7_0]